MRESRHLEFKECVSNTFLKTVSAYANYGGGEILFGVADDGREVGLEDQAGADATSRDPRDIARDVREAPGSRTGALP